jgi:hypothetical protein
VKVLVAAWQLYVAVNAVDVAFTVPVTENPLQNPPHGAEETEKTPVSTSMVPTPTRLPTYGHPGAWVVSDVPVCVTERWHRKMVPVTGSEASMSQAPFMSTAARAAVAEHQRIAAVASKPRTNPIIIVTRS